MKISDLQTKDVVNVGDGRKLGQIHDLDIDLRAGQIRALVVPGETRLFGLLTGGKEWVIPWSQIVKIGSDVILVRLDNSRFSSENDGDPRPLLTHPSNDGP
ncbi:YlmC/YmxH family sporulation protein [Desmospora profundinema]|uniref:YlmC/YmxH family sporulation protein n=1 Tax=Desmospora profundinema TaxID=1571184 RepID=A0ABU1IJ48_9BACL|nr:YlmC/YmxH family sporulation protein [Desmospora profundinema]MDR6224787.1 YlmC/YmxH family sporulation protein [Desmospora profundinema]